MKYTVITLRDSTGEVGAQHVEADDPHAAMATVAEATGGLDRGLQVLCAITGEHQAVTACEDSGKAAYATDLIRDWECGHCHKTVDGHNDVCECGDTRKWGTAA